MQKRHVSFAAALGLAISFATCAASTENGVTAYPLGVNTFGAGFVPLPGQTWIMNYTQYYSSSTFAGNNGKGGAVPGFRASIIADAVRVFHTWDFPVGPFSLSSAIVAIPATGNVGTRAFPNARTSGTNVADITIEPAYLGFSNEQKNLFVYFGPSIYIPLGGWLTNNFYSFGVLASLTWFPVKELEFSSTVQYEWHTKNYRTQYQSGDVLTIDYGINWFAFPSLPDLTIGVGGYGATQTSDDYLYTKVVQNKGLSTFAVGPQVGYKLPLGAVAFKWQHEVYAANKPRGERFWVQFYLPVDTSSL